MPDAAPRLQSLFARCPRRARRCALIRPVGHEQFAPACGPEMPIEGAHIFRIRTRPAVQRELLRSNTAFQRDTSRRISAAVYVNGSAYVCIAAPATVSSVALLTPIRDEHQRFSQQRT